jgi:hypothetical protein
MGLPIPDFGDVVDLRKLYRAAVLRIRTNAFEANGPSGAVLLWVSATCLALGDAGS